MKHLDEGTIQAFLDGELTEDSFGEVSEHLEACEKCAVLLANAESEIDVLAVAFAEDKSFAVPTQRIWARIENQLETIEKQPLAAETHGSVWKSFTQFFTFPRLILAGSCAVFVIGATIAFQVTTPTSDKKNPINDVAAIQPPSQIQTPIFAKNEVKTPEIAVNNPNATVKVKRLPIKRSVDDQEVRIEKAVFSQSRKAKPSGARNVIESIVKTPPTNIEPQVLPEEKGLLDTIARLKKEADNNRDDLAMRPSFRVEYEKNLAVIDKAINNLQKQARKNPKDEITRQMLLASYRNKIELIGTIAEKSQIIASLR